MPRGLISRTDMVLRLVMGFFWAGSIIRDVPKFPKRL